MKLKPDNQEESTKLAVLEVKLDNHLQEYKKDYSLFKEKQDFHHETNRKVHTEINLLSQKVDNMGSALLNNTKVCDELRGVCEHLKLTIDTVGSLVKELISEKEVTKSNISVLSKAIVWIIVVAGACGGFIKFMGWK